MPSIDPPASRIITSVQLTSESLAPLAIFITRWPCGTFTKVP
jgi:hypothetical protein